MRGAGAIDDNVDGDRDVGKSGERGQSLAVELTAEGRAPLDPVVWRTLETVCGELAVPLPE